ncbi:MAG: molybdopterin-dependent oxidoreductase [Nitriliruptoraceae bacterium]
MARRASPGSPEANGTNSIARATVGVTAAFVAIGISELVAGILPGRRSPLSAIGDAIIDATPGPIVRWAIVWFGSANRLALLSSMALVVAALGIIAGIIATRRRLLARAIFAFVAVAAATVLAADALTPIVTAITAPLLAGLAGIAVLEWLLRRVPGRNTDIAPAVTAPGTASSDPDEASPDANGAGSADEFDPSLARTPTAGLRSRRNFLLATGGSLAAGLAAALAGQRLMARQVLQQVRDQIALPRPRAPLPAPEPSASFAVDGLSPIITPTNDFFRIDARLNPLRLDGTGHVVTIKGLVDNPFEITYEEILDLAVVEADVTLSCVSNEVGGPLIGTARWQGVPLTDLLDRAGVQDGADQIVGRAVDTWTAGFPLEAAYDGRTALVAVGMNGEPLPARHGFPVRLVVEGLYGYVCNTKWLSEIELTTFADYQAYWIRLGWAPFGPIKTQSRIDVPRHQATVPAGTVTIAGVAWSNEHGVDGAEVRIDDGPWMVAEVTEPLARGTWRQWRHLWDASPGRHRISVRAIDAQGEPQTEVRRPPDPDGATGHHTVTVTVS